MLVDAIINRPHHLVMLPALTALPQSCWEVDQNVLEGVSLRRQMACNWITLDPDVEIFFCARYNVIHISDPDLDHFGFFGIFFSLISSTPDHTFSSTRMGLQYQVHQSLMSWQEFCYFQTFLWSLFTHLHHDDCWCYPGILGISLGTVLSWAHLN